jgi:hypothetical protein
MPLCLSIYIFMYVPVYPHLYFYVRPRIPTYPYPFAKFVAKKSCIRGLLMQASRVNYDLQRASHHRYREIQNVRFCSVKLSGKR